MAEQLGIEESEIERILNHQMQRVKAVYQRQEYRERRKSALRAGGMFVSKLT